MSTAAQEVHALGLGAGALPVVEPLSHGGEAAARILDAVAGSGWACASGKAAGNAFIFALPVLSTVTRIEPDIASIDTDGAGAEGVTGEISSRSATAGFEPVLRRASRTGRTRSASRPDRRPGVRAVVSPSRPPTAARSGAS